LWIAGTRTTRPKSVHVKASALKIGVVAGRVETFILLNVSVVENVSSEE
jgi:hypothetical protein